MSRRRDDQDQLSLFEPAPEAPAEAPEAPDGRPAEASATETSTTETSTTEAATTGPVEAPTPPLADAAAVAAVADLADAAARRLAQTELERPLLVEAGAGTGKTTTLTGRILAWSLGPGWEASAERLAGRRGADEGPPEADRIAAETLARVVAITFTEAAAAEMAHRVGTTLATLAAPSGGESDDAREGDDAPAAPPWLVPDALPAPAERGRRARALLGALDHLVVRTIHGFCRGLLAAHPLEAELHPELTVDPDRVRLEEIAREVVEDRLREAYGAPGDPDLLALAGDGVGPPELVEALVELVGEGVAASDLEHDPFDAATVDGLVAELAVAAGRLAELAAPFEAAGRSKNSIETLDAVHATKRAAAGEKPGSGPEAPDARLDRLARHLAEIWPDPVARRLGDWSKGRLNKTETALVEDLQDALAHAAGELRAVVDRLTALDPARFGRARRALAPLLAAVRREMRRRGVVTFSDLLLEARDLLRRRGDVAARVRRRIDQLLVDELQDTDQLQVEIVTILGFEGPADERPGLFLVGDPKQSIYGWRNADLVAYEALRRRVEEAGGVRVALSVNFRSVPAVLDEVERVMGPIMVEEAGVQPPFEPLVPSPDHEDEPGFARGEAAPVEYWVSRTVDGGAKTRKGDATALEAEAMARDLARLHRDEGLAWRDAALLLRSFSDLDDYLEALRRAGVPFAVTGDRQYYRRREVIDAAALVRAVLDPGDHLALLTFLRSPVVGVPDAALVPLWNQGLPRLATGLDAPSERGLGAVGAAVRRAAEEVEDLDVPGLEAVDGWPTTLLAGLEALASLRASFRRDPADRFLERLRRWVPFEPLAAARYLGRYRLANLERFFRRLGDALEDDRGDVGSILRALRRGVAEAQEEEEGRPTGGDDDAVQVMTIHGAKGLDFGHVYLPQLHKERPRPSTPWLGVERGGADDDGGRGRGGREGDARVELCLFGAPTPGFGALREAAGRREAAERVRLLYVAMTRAEERLVLAGGWGDKVQPPERATCFLDLLAPRFGDLDLETPWEEALADGPARLDRHGVRWVFPALEVGGAEEPIDATVNGATSGAADGTADEPPVVSPSRLLQEAERLDTLRRSAARRQARPLGAAASAAAHHRLEALERERPGTGVVGVEPAREGTDGRHGADDREVALTVGTAVHRALERLDLGAPAENLLARAAAPEALLPPLSPAVLETARERTAEILEALAAGPLAGRLARLAGRVVARELPVLLPAPEDATDDRAPEDDPPPNDDAPPDDAAPAPVGFVAGSVDLVYRDPDDGRLVVADYKTDRVTSDEDLERRARAYAPQLEIYARALAEGLGADEDVRRELWFLGAHRVVEV